MPYERHALVNKWNVDALTICVLCLVCGYRNKGKTDFDKSFLQIIDVSLKFYKNVHINTGTMLNLFYSN